MFDSSLPIGGMKQSGWGRESGHQAVNNYLQTKSNEHCIPHVSIVDELINDDNSTKMEYYIDYCHLNYKMINNIVVKKFKEINIFV